MRSIFIECVAVALKIVGKLEEKIGASVLPSEERLEEGIPLGKITGSLSGVACCGGCLRTVILINEGRY